MMEGFQYIKTSLLIIGIGVFGSGCAHYRSSDEINEIQDSITLPAEYSTSSNTKLIYGEDVVNTAFTTGLFQELSQEQSQELFQDQSQWQPQEQLQQWWQLLEDTQMTGLIEQALEKNYSLEIAHASLAEAYALLGFEKLERYPQIQANARGLREKTSEDVRLPGSDAITETYSAGLDASWELDVFGSVRNKVKAAKATLAEREANLQAMQISIAAETAKAYIDLRGAQHQLAVAEENVRNLANTLDLTQRLKEIGRGDQLDVSRAQAQLSVTEAQLPQFHANITAALNRLSVLTGEHNSSLRQTLAQTKTLPNVPATLHVGTPQDLIRRRPDIQQAEQQLAAAIARYNVRVADLYPSITFNGGLGYLATDLDHLGESSTETFSFGPSIHWAAFDLGRVNAQIRAADARAQAQVAAFKQTVLQALEETDNALQSFAQEEVRRAKLIQAMTRAKNQQVLRKKNMSLGRKTFLVCS